MRFRQAARAAIAWLLALAVVPIAQPVQASGVPAFDHVFVIVMENRSYGEIIGSPSAPYVNSLLPSAALGASYHGVTHPSLPNYLALTSGATWNITTDCTTCWVSGTNIGDLLENAGSTWKAYEESMPSPCYVGDSYPYAQKHDPFIYFNDIRNNTTRCQSHVVPYSQLGTDLQSTSTTPNYAFITPNMCNDMHDCATSVGDAWLAQQVPHILASPAFTTQRSLLALTWDEDDYSGTNRVPLLLLGSSVRAGYQSTLSYNHYSLLRTIELARDLPYLTANDENASPLSDMFGSFTPLPTDPCQTATLAASPPASQAVGSTVQLTATATGCINPEFEFWILAPGASAYQLVQPYSSSATYTWSTAGLATGAYTISVWAHAAGSTGVYGNSFGRWDAYAPISYSLVPRGCTALTLSAAPVSATAVGSSPVFTATSTCPDPNPVYQFWTLAPGASSWTVAQAYSTSNTLTWSTSGEAPGGWQVAAWVRDANSGGVYSNSFGTWDVFRALNYTVTTCSGLSLAASPASRAGVGSSPNVTAGSTGCPNANPTYQFWTLAPGATGWTLAQVYSTSNTFAWSTAGKTPGAWQVAVWARDAQSGGAHANSFGSWDQFSALNYQVTTCTGATVSASALSAAAGTSIAFTASAAGCPNPSPNYQFWILAPGASSWTLVQPYSTSNTFTWSTTGDAAGTYQVAVWARDPQSGGAYANSFGTWDVFTARSYSVS